MKSKISPQLLERITNKNFKNVFRAYALPCPGCYLNKEVYFNNKRMRWDNSMCLEINKSSRKENRILKDYADLFPENDGDPVTSYKLKISINGEVFYLMMKKA